MALIASAASAEDAVFDANGAFTFSYPASWTLAEDPSGNTATYQFLGRLNGPLSSIEIGVSDDRESYGDFTVPHTECSDYYAYLANLFTFLTDSDAAVPCSFEGTCLSGDGKALFMILRVTDGDGDFYYADTMLGGCTVSLYAYSTLAGVDSGERQKAELESLLSTLSFNPTLIE